MLHLMFPAGSASIPGSLADPPGSSVIVAAVWWLQATLLGTLATTVAIIAIASVGLLMLGGRVNIRYGLTIIAGSFILFGASSIVAGIETSIGGGDAGGGPYAQSPALTPPPEPQPAPPLPANNDPYAGAAVPMR